MATILIVDDSPTSRQHLVDLLSDANHRLVEAGDGVEGLAKVRAERPDLVITDLVMPTMDGYEFVRQLRCDPAIAGTPVVFCSGKYHEWESSALAEAGGVLHQLIKPVQLDEISRVVDEVLAEAAFPAPPPPGEDFTRAHLRLLADKLARETLAPEPIRDGHPGVGAWSFADPQARALPQSLPHLSERTLLHVLETVPDAVVVIDNRGVIVLANAHAERMFGYERAELIGATVEMLVPKRNRGQHVRQRGDFFQAPRTRALGERAPLFGRHKDGREFPVEISLNPLETEEGMLVTSVIRDVTERKKHDTRLAKAEARYRSLVEEIPAVTFMADLDGGLNEIYVSPQIEQMLGFSQQEWLSDPVLWHRQLHADDRERWHVEFARTCATAEPFRSVYRFMARDGRIVWVLGQAKVVRDKDGKPLFLQGVAFDITDRKNAEEELERLNQTLAGRVAERTAELNRTNKDLERLKERYYATVESAPNAMVMIDVTGKIVLANAQAEALFGYTRNELLDQTIELLVPERYRAGHPGLREGFFAHPTPRRMGAGRELHGLRKDGTEFPVEIGLNPVKTGEGLFVLSAIADITERKRHEHEIKRYAEDLERTNRELDQFAYSASHDLKAPLRAVDNLAQWIAEDAGHLLPEESMHDLTLMRQRIERMQRLLDDLLAYSRVGRVQHKVERLDSQELVRDIVKLLAPPEGFTIVIGALPVLAAERTPLEQVFLNLIGNAIKHHHRADGRIEIFARDLGDQVEFVVRDDGPGIAAEYHEQVFEMFQTLRPRDEVEGSGMGLALVKKIVETQGGTITLQSTVGGGATFFITWPHGPREASE